jgi:APA family basic amino acid/polyamine antiporter
MARTSSSRWARDATGSSTRRPLRRADDGRLPQLLGVGFGVAVTVGGTIGVGILRTPGLVAGQLPDPWLIAAAWLVGGGYALVGTLSVVELATALPAAGGWYVYARRAFGSGAGFVVGWIDWLAQSASLAYLAVSVADFAVTLAPLLAPAATLLAFAPLAAFALVQWLGLKESSRAQQATGLAKGLALLAFVAVCFAHGPEHAATEAASGGTSGAGIGLLTLAGAVIALQSVIVTYDGWYSAIYFTEEDRDPGRNLPRPCCAC